MVSVTGMVDHIIYRNEENGYTVFIMKSGSKELTCVGTAPDISEGEYLRADGEYTEHQTYGKQLKISALAVEIPEDEFAIERYLGSGVIKGVGPSLSGKIVEKFGRDTFRIIEEEPERLAEVKGISARKAADIYQQFHARTGMRQAMMYMARLGITTNLSLRIYKQYGEKVYTILAQNPYQLAEDMTGVGFKQADEIAKNAGLGLDSGFRIRSGILYIMQQAAQAGASLVVFPEMALTGYAYADEEDAANGQAAVDAAEPIDGPYAARIADLAVAHDMYVIFGTAEPVGDGAHAYNAAFVCAPDGSIQSYRKIAPVEGPWCVAGKDPLVVDTPFGSLGISICKDTYAYPELARYYMARGCTFVANPTARTGVADGWADLYENALENLADQDKVIVVSADLCGADLDAPAEQAGWEPYTGASVITAPLAKGADGSYVRTWGSYASDPSATGLVTAEIDLGELSLGHGEAIQSFNPRLYAALYEGETFQNTSADLSAAGAAA